MKLDRDKPAASVLWPQSRAVAGRVLSNTSTPLILGDCVFSAKSSGQFVCLDVGTGEQLWETDKVTALKGGASIHLTPSGSSVLLYSDRGELIRARLGHDGYHAIILQGETLHDGDRECVGKFFALPRSRCWDGGRRLSERKLANSAKCHSGGSCPQ